MRIAKYVAIIAFIACAWFLFMSTWSEPGFRPLRCLISTEFRCDEKEIRVSGNTLDFNFTFNNQMADAIGIQSIEAWVPPNSERQQCDFVPSNSSLASGSQATATCTLLLEKRPKVYERNRISVLFAGTYVGLDQNESAAFAGEAQFVNPYPQLWWQKISWEHIAAALSFVVGILATYFGWWRKA